MHTSKPNLGSDMVTVPPEYFSLSKGEVRVSATGPLSGDMRGREREICQGEVKENHVFECEGCWDEIYLYLFMYYTMFIHII